MLPIWGVLLQEISYSSCSNSQVIILEFQFPRKPEEQVLHLSPSDLTGTWLDMPCHRDTGQASPCARTPQSHFTLQHVCVYKTWLLLNNQGKQSHQNLACLGTVKTDKRYTETAATDHSLIHSTSPGLDNKFTPSNSLHIHPTATTAGFPSCPGTQ